MINFLKKDSIYFLTCFFILIFSRLKTSLLNINVLNPDEYQLAANSIKFKNFGIDLNFFDGYSLGLYNAIFLYLPSLIGLEITIFFVRLLGLILIIISLYFIYKTILIISNELVSKLYILIAIIFFSFTKDPDFLSFNGEILFCLVFSITLYLITNILYKKYYSNLQFFFIGVIIGSIFFIKLQFIFYLISFILIIIIFYFKKKISFYNIAYFIFGLVSHIFIIFIFFKADLNNFLVNNFFKSIAYINDNNYKIFAEKNIIDDLSKIKKINPFFYHLKFNLIFHYLYSLSLIFITFLFLKKKNIFTKKNFEFFIIYTIIFVSILISIIVPGKMFRHYLYPLIFLCPVISAYSFNFLKNNLKKNMNYYKILFSLVFIFIIVSAVFENRKYYALNNAKILKIQINEVNKKYNLFNSLLNSELKTAFIWGWMPQWYVIGNLSPVTSETTTENQLKNNKLTKYLTYRIKKEIFIHQPDLIIDSVRGESFVFNNSKNNFEEFLKEDKLIFLKNYFKVENKFQKKDCALLYLNKRFKKTYDKIIKVENIFFKNNKENNTLKNLLDFSITKDTCDDELKIIKEDNSEISIIFSKAEYLDSILILNSKTSMALNLESSKLVLKFYYNDEFKKDKIIQLNKYPQWSKILFKENLKVNRVDLFIMNSSVDNLYLNEIIFIRR